MDATDLLRAWSEGDEAALNELMPLVEQELRRLARAHMRRERYGHTLQATALVNEMFLRLAHGETPRCHDRAHFVAIAARLMRQVLVDHARSRGSLFSLERFRFSGNSSAFDIHPDGKRFVMVTMGDAPPPLPDQINVVLNWFDDLKRRAPAGR